MILVDGYMVNDKRIVLNDEQIKRREEINMDITKREKHLRETRKTLNEIELQCVLDSIKNGY